MAILLFCAAFTVVGFQRMLRFSGTAGEQMLAPRRWPASTHILRSSARSTLVLFAHPFCSCSKATLGELARVLDQQDRATRPDVRILFFRPASDSDWKRGDLWSQAAAIKGATVAWDPGGQEANRFAARTSGFIALYNRQGIAQFQGGITGARGHMGDNYGTQQLARVLRFGRPEMKRPLVFGCSLLGSNLVGRAGVTQ